jgi:hypothetical protein
MRCASVSIRSTGTLVKQLVSQWRLVSPSSPRILVKLPTASLGDFKAFGERHNSAEALAFELFETGRRHKPTPEMVPEVGVEPTRF